MSTIDERNALRASLEARGVRVVLDLTTLADEPTDGTVLLLSPDEFTPETSDAPTRQSRRRSRSIKAAIDASALRLESLPLFAPDNMLGAALFGPDRVQEWCQIAPMLEARGLPKVDPLMGGRYKRAVVAFFDQQYGLDRGANAPLAPDGVEDFDSWKRRKRPV